MSINTPPELSTDSSLADRQARLILESAVDYAIVGLDLDGVIVSWNVGAERIMGWLAEEAVGLHVGLFFTPEDLRADIPGAEMRAAVKHGRGIDERWHMRKDGSRFWANGEMMPLRWLDGEVEGYVKILRDRTRQHEAVAALANSEERYQALYDSIDEGFCLIEVRCDDAAQPIDYRFREVNPAFERQTGLVGAAGSWVRDLVPGLEQHWFDTYAKVALTGETARFTLPAQALNSRWYEVFAYRVGAPAERLVAVLFSDITERRTSEARMRADKLHLHALNKTLHESQARQAALLSASSDVSFIMSPDWTELRQLSGGGFLADTVTTDPAWWDRYIHPEDQPILRVQADQAIRSGTPFRFEHRVRRTDGTPGWAASRAVPIRDAEGTIIEWFGSASDISERRQAEAELVRATRLRAALIALTDQLRDEIDPAAISRIAGAIVGTTLGADLVGYGVVDPAAETITVDADWTAPGAVSLAGVARFRDYGVYIDDLKAGRTVIIHDAWADPRTRDFAAALAERSAVAFVNTPIQERGAFVALLYVSQARPRTWEEDELAFIREVAARVRASSERARSDAALRTLNARLEAEVEARTRERDRLWDSSADLLVVADFGGRLVRTSPSWQAVLGHDAATLARTPYPELIHPDDQERVAAVLTEMFRTGQPTRYENRVRAADGTWHSIAWTLSPEPGGTLLSGIGRDVTLEREQAAVRERLEEQLRQSQKMEAVGQLTGGLAHDFNNLLTGVVGALELLNTRIAQGRTGEAGRYVGAAQDAAKRAAALTHRLLAFSRRQTLDPKPTDMNRLVGGMEELIRRTIGPAIELGIIGASGLWATLVDPPQLENALLNLCINARDAMPGGGRLTVETSNRVIDGRTAQLYELAEGQYAILCVSDTGTGMPPDVIAKAFDPFFTTKPIGLGTGLGLSMIYGFARQSGGQVRIHSEVGQGSTVCLYLPRHLAEAEAAELLPDLADAPRATAGETVLVVDDEPTVRLLVTEVLEDLGYAAIEAGDGKAGLKVLQSDARIDLLVTDVGLPGGMNGRQMADAARVARPDLKVLFITGYAENAVVGNGNLEAGMHIMTKPFALEALATRIRDLIGAG